MLWSFSIIKHPKSHYGRVTIISAYMKVINRSNKLYDSRKKSANINAVKNALKALILLLFR